MPRRRNSKAKRAQHARKDARSCRLHSVQSGNASDSGAAASEYNSRLPIANSSPSTHASPIHNLPPELLREAFILALPTDEEILKRSQPDLRPQSTPFTFCAVCSLWRSLAFSTPQLWQQVFVYISACTGRRLARRKAVGLVQWISRALSLPLTLFMFCDPNRVYSLTPIVSALNDHATRWKSLYLQSLERGWMDSLSPLFCFGRWHSLRRAYFRNLLVRIPWAQLTHLQFCTSMSSEEAMSVFTMCSKLVELSICVFWDPDLVMAANHVTLHDLVTFSVKSYRPSEILEALSLPSLRDLHLYAVSPTDLPSLLNFFTRSSCTLDTRTFGFRLRHCLSLLAHKSCELLTALLRFCGIEIPLDAEILWKLILHQNDSLPPHSQFLTVDCCMSRPPSALLKLVLMLTNYWRNNFSTSASGSSIVIMSRNWTKSARNMGWNTSVNGVKMIFTWCSAQVLE